MVSELVAGQTLAERLRAGRPSFRQSAEWLAVLADALAHAHRHGVIHRDIKPSNILLDAEGQPRLTDFGLARYNADDGIVTEEGQMLGTPAYMSPEQARGEASRLDARTDVYSLGVVLYELLTGELPFRGNNRMLLRQVLEEEPRPPRRVNDDVPRDLETVCLKAMAKEPARRYAGAADFADDLRRFLQGQPVRARPVGTAGRLVRWGRRKPALAGMTAALLLVAAVGFAGVIWQWRQAATHLAEANRQRDRARDNARQAHLAINDFISIGRNPLLERTDLSIVRQQIWQTGLKYYRGFLEQDDNDPTFTDSSLREDTAAAHTNFGFLQERLGQPAQAETMYAKAQELWQRLLDDEPQNAYYKIGRARTLFYHARIAAKQGRPDEALELYRKASELFGDLHSRPPPADANRQLPTASYEFRTSLADSNCQFLMACYEGMGGLYEGQGRLREARDFQEQARLCGETYLKEQPASVTVRYKLVEVYGTRVRLEQKRGHTDLALQAHRRGVEIGQRLVELAPNIASYRFLLTHLQQRLASLHRAAGQNEQALRAYQESDQLLASILQQDPAHFDARYMQAQNRYYCCNCLHRLGRREEALDICLRAYQLTRQLDRDHPSNANIQTLLAEVCFWLGKLRAETRHQAEAIAAFQQGAELYGRLAQQGRGEPKWRFMQGTCLHSIGTQLVGPNQVGQAADCYRRAAALREGACRDAPNNLAWHADTAGTWNHLGEMEERLGHAEEALTAYQRAVEHLRAAAKDRPKTENQRRPRDFLQDAARMLKKLGRDDQTAAVLRECAGVSRGGSN